MRSIWQGMRQDMSSGKLSRSAIYRRLVKRFRATRRGFGFAEEFGEKKDRSFYSLCFSPETNIGLLSLIIFIPSRAPERMDVFDGPLEIRRHALERLHQRTGLIEGYDAWADEFRLTLRALLLLFKQPGYWMENHPDRLLPTENGALLGLFDNYKFIGRTWLHNVDLDLEKRAEVQRIRTRIENEQSSSVEHWLRLLESRELSALVAADKGASE